MTRIFMEDYELDLTADITQSITYAIDDITRLDTKATSFTKTIVIPGTARNNELFGNIFDFGNSNFTSPGSNVFYNFDASRSAKARIEINGLRAMKGVLRLLRIVHDKGNIEYEVALFGELGGFVANLGAKKLEDLDFSKYNHNWNETNIVNSWDSTAYYDNLGPINYNATSKRIKISGALLTKLIAGDSFTITNSDYNDGTYSIVSIRFSPIGGGTTTIYVNESLTSVNDTGTDTIIEKIGGGLGSGYVYPLINYGLVTSNDNGFTKYKDWQFKAFRPAIFVREYIDRIITGAGYTWQSDFFNTNFFKRLIIPNNDIAMQKIGESYYIEANTEESYSKSLGTLEIKNVLWDNTPTLSNFSYSAGKFTFTGSASQNMALNVKANGTFTQTIKAGTFQLALTINNQTIQTTNIQITDLVTEFDITLTHNAQIFPGDVIELKYIFTNIGIVSNTLTADILASITAEANPKAYVNYGYDELINMNHLIPKNVLQKDFFASILKLFNLMVIEDKNIERHLIIEPDATFYNTDRTTYVDWSDKVDRSLPISIQPMSEANARYYQLMYKTDSDYFNDEYKKKFGENYGDRIFDNQLEFSKESQKVEVIFSSSVLTGYDGEVKVFPTICKINAGVEEPMAHNIRIMQCKLIKGIDSWKMLNDATELQTLTDYMYAGHFNDPDYPTSDLNFGATRQLYFALVSGSLQNNMFNAFYSPYMAEITDKDSRLVTFNMRLMELDIFAIDWRRFIFIDGILYRLKKIIDWTEDNVCKVEMLKAINTTYLSEMIYFDTIEICSQVWAKQNLYEKYYNNGDPIIFASTEQEWQTALTQGIGAYCYYKFDSQYDNPTYGLFYNGYVLTDPRGICPQGWRLPSNADFPDIEYCYGDANKLKETGTFYWASGNTNTNDSGFSLLGLGYYDGENQAWQYDDMTRGYLWTTDEVSASPLQYKAWYYIYDQDTHQDEARVVKDGIPIRLIKI